MAGDIFSATLLFNRMTFALASIPPQPTALQPTRAELLLFISDASDGSHPEMHSSDTEGLARAN